MKAPTISYRSKLASKTYGSMSKSMGVGEGIDPSLGKPVAINWEVDGFQSGITIEQADSAMNLTWVDGSTNEDYILIERSLDRINFVGINVVPPNTTSYSDDITGIEAENIYYRITAIRGHKYNKSEVQIGTNSNYNTPPEIPEGAIKTLSGEYIKTLDGEYIIAGTNVP